MHPALNNLREFDVDNSDVSVWTFKKSVQGKTPVFTGRWIETTDTLNQALREAVKSARAGVTETIEYGLLAQNNESSALTIGADETYSSLIVDQSSDPTPKKKVKNQKELSNSIFYAVKLVSGKKSLYGLRKTDDSWKTKISKDSISVLFTDHKLTLDDSTRFSLSRYFDLFIVDQQILILKKSKFESILSYKEAHIDDFKSLQSENEFSSLFTTMQPLLDYVGSNKIQLRRVSAIRQKGNYKDADFMKNLRAECASLGLKIEFDAHGKIIPTADTCRDIVQALLDHRLDSRLSKRIFDVESTVAV